LTELSNSLYFLQLESNHLRGTIPQWIHQLSHLQYLGLSHNELNGIIPKSINQLSLLMELDLSGNQFNGPIDLFDRTNETDPSSSSCPPYLKLIYLHDNDYLNGEITNQTFYDCQYLQEINLSNNRLVGYIPHHFYHRKMVNIEHNMISGTIPNVTTTTSPLEYISLSNNLIGGTIPVSIYLLKNLIHLDLSHNQLQGEISDVLDSMDQIEYLYLSNNTKLAPDIIPYFKDTSNLKHLSLSQSNRIGTIPTWLGSMSTLIYLDLQSNMLNGTIPSQIGSLHNMQYLFLNNNSLSGTIPTSFRHLTNMEQVSFHHNSLNGSLESILCDGDGHVLSTVSKLQSISTNCNRNSIGLIPEVTCSCCTTCCSTATGSDGKQNSACTSAANADTTGFENFDSPMTHIYKPDHFLYIDDLSFSS
jgi:Leucine-rich repeat (LRR) protein